MFGLLFRAAIEERPSRFRLRRTTHFQREALSGFITIGVLVNDHSTEAINENVK